MGLSDYGYDALSPNPAVVERLALLARLGIPDDPNLSIGDLRQRTGDGADAESATRISGKTVDQIINQFSQAAPIARGATVALLGDSFTALNAPPGGYGPSAGAQWYPGNGWWDWADTFLGKRTLRAGTFGVGGNTTAQILARISSVTSLNPKPTFCVVQGGTNDTNLNVDPATTIANMQAICDQLMLVGIYPILTSVPPVPYTSPSQLASVAAILTAQKDIARKTRGVIFCDWRPYVVNPIDGTWQAGLSDDGIHPNSVGCARLGKALADTLAPLIPAVDTLLSTNNNPKLLNANPMMLGTGGVVGNFVTGSSPDDWKTEMWNGDTVVAATSSVIDTGPFTPRKWQIALTDGSIQLRSQPSTWAVGDKIYAECAFEFDANQPFSNIDKINLQIDILGVTGTSQDPNAPSSDSANHPAGNWMTGVLRTPVITVPTGTTGVTAKFIVRRIAGTTPSATFRVTRFAFLKV